MERTVMQIEVLNSTPVDRGLWMGGKTTHKNMKLILSCGHRVNVGLDVLPTKWVCHQCKAGYPMVPLTLNLRVEK